VTVHRVYQDGDGWRAETSEGSEWHPAIISATGRFGAPIMPHFPGADDFAGTLIHAREYLGGEPYTGKRVMVVGNGPSGVDIVTELADVAQTPVLFSQRTGLILSPRYPFGLPKHLWVMIGEFLPDFISKRLIQPILKMDFKNIERYGIKTPKDADMSSSAAGTRGRELIEVFKAGKVKSVEAPACFERDAVILTDGNRYVVDAVIMVTGYKPVLFNYLDLDAETDSQGWLRRLDDLDEGGMRQVAGYPGLYLVGVFYKGKGAMYNFNTEGEQAVKEIQQRLKEIDYRPPVEIVAE
jgi:hypothetical protein